MTDRGGAGRGLSAKLLALTAAFIMLAEVLVFIPSVGRALESYATQAFIELERGALAFEVLGAGEAEPQTIGNNLTLIEAQAIQQELLRDTGWIAYAARLPDSRSLMTNPQGIPAADRHVSSGGAQDSVRGRVALVGHALVLTLDIGRAKTLRLSGVSRDGRTKMDIWLDDGPIRADLRAYGLRVLGLSLVISVFAAALVYISLRALIVRPILRLRSALARFAAAPQDATARVRPSHRRDEIGFIETETRAMQDAVADTLQQKERLAALGGAVAQVNHDLRGMLSTALLLSDSMESSADPRVAKAAPVLANSIERAVELCSATLRYARGDTALTDLRLQPLPAFLQALCAEWQIRWPDAAFVLEGLDPRLDARFDQTALTRVLDNLARNSLEAGAQHIRLVTNQGDQGLEICLHDNGPGLPEKAKADLFVPFAGSTKTDGTGLGLANAAQLMQAMDGSLVLGSSSAAGTMFVLHLKCDQAP